jgi:hypothetical protein
MTNAIPTFSVGEIFNSGRYIIPIYQRNYAWGEPEITQLIQDIWDFADSDKRLSNYYIGTLVVYERHKDDEVIYETIDGQQRLTTLNILLCVLHREFKGRIDNVISYTQNLSFDSRKKSTETLTVISRPTNDLQYVQSIDYNPNIQQAYLDIEKLLKRLLDTDEKLTRFYNFLKEKVHIMRVSVPEDTDLNHYFEIMNSRGEQLEKHEILKAKMLEVLHDDEKLSYTFNLIWEACADMERYVQYGFTPEQRSKVFTSKHWNQLSCKTLEEVAEMVFHIDKNSEPNQLTKTFSILDIVNYTESFGKAADQKEDAPDRFTSVINFSNFLLHVLRIQTGSDISLDDKRLIDLFNEEFLKFKEQPESKKNFVKNFGFNLLKCKWLFDNFIIKREFIREQDQWSLKRLKWYDGNRVSYVNSFGEEDENNGANKEILMLLAMFHVSTPTLVYKHWLNAALRFVFINQNVTADDYCNYLKDLAKAFLYDRYLATDSNRVEFYDIIYNNEGKSLNKDDEIKQDLDLLNKGTYVENFIFNLLDFILWRNQVDGWQAFEFAFRSSVEHYYPQNPIAKDLRIDASIYNLFGNLCLISSSKNSKLSNHLPEAKKDYYLKAKPDSLKQKEMMNLPKWEEEQIRSEGKRMTELLLNF